jgi:hypothetical protein
MDWKQKKTPQHLSTPSNKLNIVLWSYGRDIFMSEECFTTHPTCDILNIFVNSIFD